MTHCYHLLIKSAIDDTVMVEWHLGKWLLPTCIAEAEARAANAVAEALEALHLSGFLARVPCGHVSQALDDVDWLSVVIVDETEKGPRRPSLRWENIDLLRPETALSPVQGVLLTHHGQRSTQARSEVADDTRAWFEAVHEWTNRALAATRGSGTRALSFRPLRASRTRTVIAFDTQKDGRFFFRANHDGPFAEARLSEWLAHRPERLCPSTVRLDEARGWWLCAEAEGHPLASNADLSELEGVVRRLARLQIDLMAHVDRLDSLGLSRVVWSTVYDETKALLTSLHDAPADLTKDLGTAPKRGLAAAALICRQASALNMPITWVDTDLTYENIFVSTEGLQLIDLEQSTLAFPHVAIETFLTNIARVAPFTIPWQERLRSVFRNEWTPYVHGNDMKHAESISVPACRLAKLAARSRATERKIARGELLADLSRLRRRVARQLLQRLVNTELPGLTPGA